MNKTDVIGAAAGVAEELNADVFLLNAPFNGNLDQTVATALLNRKKRENAALILVTEGGDPDIAYRIARGFQGHYAKISAIVSGWCKSAGTLCVLGAHEIAFGDFGELGPLDIQYFKKDEISETASGLVVSEALNKLQSHAFKVFERSMLGIINRSQGQVSFKLASEVAARMAIGVCEPLYRQIDPHVLGDLERGMTIAKDYGRRLLIKSKNSSLDQLIALAESYPSHGFVIDQREAETLFNNVRSCTEQERKLLNALRQTAIEPSAQPVAMYLSPEFGVSNEDIKRASASEADASGHPSGRARSDVGDSQGASAAGTAGAA